jgi:hypothetical protein
MLMASHKIRALAVLASVALASAALGTAAHADEAGCKALNGRSYPAATMSLPQNGAKITKADWIAARPNFQAYCKVAGEIAPLDQNATVILWALNLPETWNKKAVQEGGGGLNGTLVQANGLLRDSPPGSAPLAKGFVTLGTDGGHPNAKPEIGVFFLNAEAVTNNSYGANKKAHDLSLTIINDYYGAKPDKFYFFGGSEGGRQAMVAVQRYPADYDGVVAVVPALQSTGNNLAKYNAYLASVNGGYIDKPHIKLLADDTYRQCDELDGIKDRIISKYRACLAIAKFDKIRCMDGREGGDCLSDDQIKAIQTWRHPYSWGFPLKNGYTGLPGWSIGGEDLPGSVNPWIELDQRMTLADPATEINASQWARYYVMHDGNFRGPLNLKDPAIRKRIQDYSDFTDNNNPDLGPFLARGGKLIVKENTADYAVAPEGNFAYFDKIVAKMGAKKVNSFMRFYVNPGMNHGGSASRQDGSKAPDKVDMFGELDAWVTSGKAPGTLTVTAYNAKGEAEASKPMCQLPLYPRYIKGDANVATSYKCVPH